MKTYLVGGAVRDELLNLPIKERDWVVVGATPEQMLAQGYQAVGRDFPVFLHPQTHEEYALARTERKTGAGYHGFATWFAVDVTLEQDLQRRDLTINAMAKDMTTGDIVDPYGGRDDLANRVLRHVSPAFVEDPLRVLRVARFAARYAAFGFKVADETIELMQQIAASGELESLTPERVWRETQLALATSSPDVYVQTLRDCDALKVIMPEVDALFGVPQPAQWHPEVDTGIHTLMVLQQAARLTTDPVTRFAAMMHDLGKGTTPGDILPRHIGHEARGADLVNALCTRWKVPNEYSELAFLVATQHGKLHAVFEMRNSTLLEFIEKLDGIRRADRFKQFLLACEADSRGRTGFEDREYLPAEFLQRARDVMAAIKPDAEMIANYSGAEIAMR
ncbi:MAG TPA: multifunctional CCA addition/repair protein [Steroidobacteraceae bacterium]|nr:multifunctional CCA addition/repair protein [Steroidobacteraceae bacterium]